MTNQQKNDNFQQKSILWKKLFKFSIISLLLFVFIIVGLIAGTLIGFVQASDPISPDDVTLQDSITTVYDMNQNIITSLHGDKNREMVDIKQTPKYLRNAFIAIEDKRFYEHPGIDLKRIGGAVINFFTNDRGAYGASTITQQVIKNITDQKERTIKRKVQEQWRALELERHLTKDQILEIYMNVIYMGHNCYGVGSSSKYYFGKDVSSLDLAECAILAGITNAPANYDPFTQKGKVNIKKRQEIILSEMLKMGNISEKEYKTALSEELKYSISKTTVKKNTSYQSYFVDQVVTDIKRDLVAKGYTEEEAIRKIYNNGLKIYTTMDSGIQKKLDEVFLNKDNFPVFQKNLKPQAAMVVLDPKTSQVRALYGGSGSKKGNEFNRASNRDMARQPGSTFKPIAVYAPAIDSKKITAGTVFDDVPVRLDSKNPKRYPENYDLTYSGLVSVRYALKVSLNVVASKIWTFVPRLPQVSFQYLKKVNLNRENENYVSTALGGLNKGVNPLQMASAYVPFDNQGVYYEPITYTKVLDSNEEVLLENKKEAILVYEPETAYIMTSLLSEVTRVSGTAEKYGKIQEGNMPSAGKTGTTSDNKDKWFIGFTPYYLAATWYGYDTPTPLVSSEFSQAQKLWHAAMEKIHTNLQPQPFIEPSGIVRKTICSVSGKIPSALCSHDIRGNVLREEIYIKGTEPSDDDICDLHTATKVCTASTDAFGKYPIAGSNCPSSSIKEVVMVKRRSPYVSQDAGDPYPFDWKYEKPIKTCQYHTITSENQPESEPESSSDSNDSSASEPDSSTDTESDSQ